MPKKFQPFPRFFASIAFLGLAAQAVFDGPQLHQKWARRAPGSRRHPPKVSRPLALRFPFDYRTVDQRAIQGRGRGSRAAEDRAITDIDDLKSRSDKEFMATLAKGLAVIRAFGAERPRLTLSQAAIAVGLSRATARRILLTLDGLGYVEQDGREFFLTPRVHGTRFFLSGHAKLDRSCFAAVADPQRGCRRDLLCVGVAWK